MKKFSYIFIGIILSLFFINAKSINAEWWDFGIIKTPTSTPTPSPTPKFILEKSINPDLMQVMEVVATGTTTPTQTPTEAPTATLTTTPTIPESTTTIMPTGTTMPEEPKEEGTETETGTLTTETPSETTPAGSGIQTKDIVTYVLIGAILLILLGQAFGSKKDKKPEDKKDETKNE